jgi:hypothetical protein
MHLPVQTCLTGSRATVDGGGGIPLSLWLVPKWKIGMAILDSELVRGLTKPLNTVRNVPQGLKPELFGGVFGTAEVVPRLFSLRHH